MLVDANILLYAVDTESPFHDRTRRWLDAPAVWIPAPGRGHREILGRLIAQLDLRANLISDAALAALCIEHGLSMVSADSDFARFEEIDWINPTVGR